MRVSTAGREARDYLFSACSLQIPRTKIPQMSSENSQDFILSVKVCISTAKNSKTCTLEKSEKASPQTSPLTKGYISARWLAWGQPAGLGGQGWAWSPWGCCLPPALQLQVSAGWLQGSCGKQCQWNNISADLLATAMLALQTHSLRARTDHSPPLQLSLERVQGFDSKYISLVT